MCTAGWPNTSVITLCRQTTASGCRLHHHGDFDAAGLEITGHLAERVGARHWRMDAADYIALAATSSTPLAEDVGATPWDPLLAEAMRREGKVVYEEDVVAVMLDALRGR